MRLARCWTPADQVLSSRVELAFDHRQIVADGVEHAREKLEHTALATAFCGEIFTISELQQVYEAVWAFDSIRGTSTARSRAHATSSSRTGRCGRRKPGVPPGSSGQALAEVLYPPMVRSANPPRKERTVQ